MFKSEVLRNLAKRLRKRSRKSAIKMTTKKNLKDIVILTKTWHIANWYV